MWTLPSAIAASHTHISATSDLNSLIAFFFFDRARRRLPALVPASFFSMQPQRAKVHLQASAKQIRR